jgi:hypothetical protein
MRVYPWQQILYDQMDICLASSLLILGRWQQLERISACRQALVVVREVGRRRDLRGRRLE